MFRKRNRSIIISYLTLRKLIGILGILLPFICVLGGFLFSDFPIRSSISSYYHTNMRDFFVGLLVGVSLFLLTYKGYERIDNIVTGIIGFAGLNVAIFPCLNTIAPTEPVGIFQISPVLSNNIHLISAFTFFFLLAINSIFIFTLTKSKSIPKTRNKKIRNYIYIGCGVVILLSLLILFIRALVGAEVENSKTLLVFETIMLLAFGISWLVKGETLFKDKPKNLKEKVAAAK
jgi:small-conductance mechanosensitive channel